MQTNHRRFRANRVREQLEAGQPVFGTFVYLGDPAISELLGHAGLDFVVIDMEHTLLGLETIENHVRAAHAGGTTPFVRVPENNPKLINRVLETGAAGIMLPQLKDRADAEDVVAAVKYPPVGQRGMCRVTRATSYREEAFWDYAEEANQETMIIALIEDKSAVENISAIASVEGIDVLLPGRGDLSCSYGVSGHLDHPIVNEAAEQVIAVGASMEGKAGGMVVFRPEDAQTWVDKGALFLVFSQDSRILFNAYRDAVQTLRIIQPAN
jgi:4-hydroxy-2-oxoheptanedioate aldolase